ncbi:transducin/WD40 repeat-like superfamily protein [Striga asiatica]|uniref:Transducin/WD40 repeat-like superfamily protein n=1 Tax=Striga asiatica TaxID=4170 RepID=A0A5A7QTW4_STRAF|nr:transducin/WD40 repeat-like superfamily protein [Striga asiatica]
MDQNATEIIPKTSCNYALCTLSASLHFSKGSILSIAVTKDSIFTGSSTSKIHAWKLPECMDMGCAKTPSGEIRAMSAHGKTLFTTHSDCRTRAWEFSPSEKFRLKKKATLPPRRKSFFSFSKKGNNNNSTHWHNNRVSVSCLAYDTNEELLFTGSADQTVHVWKILEKKCTESFKAHEGRVSAIVVNQQDRCVFTCSCDGTLKMWRRVYRESSHILIMVLMSQPCPINALALSSYPNDCYLYSGSSDGIINFWGKEIISGRYNHAGFLRGHHFAILCLATIGRLILSGSEDATIRIWKRENGSPLHSSLAVIDGHHGPVKCLAAVMESDYENLGGILVCSASLDQTLKVWKVKVSDS